MSRPYTQGMIDGNLTFLLADNNAFIPTGFKVLCAYEDDCLIKCVRYRFDGRIKLLYQTTGVDSLASLANQLSETSFTAIALDLFATILKVRSNGFLDPVQILLSPETIFIDRRTLSVQLIYLPINLGEQRPGMAVFESGLRHMLKTIIETTPSLTTPVLRQLTAELMNPAQDFPSLLSYLRSSAQAQPNAVQLQSGVARAQPSAVQAQRMPAPRQGGILYLSAVNAPSDTVFAVTGGEYHIGRTQGAAQGVVSWSAKVSRLHCKIVARGDGFCVSDLGSSNGTFLNGSQLAPQAPTVLRDGDILRLADVELKVTL